VMCARAGGGALRKIYNPAIKQPHADECMVGLRRLNKQTTTCSALLFLSLISGLRGQPSIGAISVLYAFHTNPAACRLRLPHVLCFFFISATS
jgi:hypothetical protein